MATFKPRSLALTGLVALLGLFKPTTADCTRAQLLTAADAYVLTQTTGKLANLQALSNGTLGYLENNRAHDIATGVLSKALTQSYRRSTADTVACASYTEFIALEPTPYVIGTQLRHNAATMKLEPVDIIAATKPALFFNASLTLELVQKEQWTELPEAKRPSREVLRKAIDGYLDLWSDATGKAYGDVPWAEPCERIEGSRYVSPCSEGTPRRGGMKANSMRRYVLDEVLGSADVLCSFTSTGDIPDSHELRIENGKLRYVHTITLCQWSGPGWPTQCPRNGTAATRMFRA